MANSTNASTKSDRHARTSPWLKLAVAALVFVAIGVVLVTNSFLSERFTETTRNRAELRLALYSGNMISELQRTSVVPLLLSRDPAISEALTKSDFSRTTQRLIQVQADIGVATTPGAPWGPPTAICWARITGQ